MFIPRLKNVPSLLITPSSAVSRMNDDRPDVYSEQINQRWYHFLRSFRLRFKRRARGGGRKRGGGGEMEVARCCDRFLRRRVRRLGAGALTRVRMSVMDGVSRRFQRMRVSEHLILYVQVIKHYKASLTAESVKRIRPSRCSCTIFQFCLENWASVKSPVGEYWAAVNTFHYCKRARTESWSGPKWFTDSNTNLLYDRWIYFSWLKWFADWIN